MADKKNLCAQIDITLHNRITEEKDRLEMTTSQYIAALLTEYLPLLDQLRQTGLTCILVEMPFHLATCLRSLRKRRRTGTTIATGIPREKRLLSTGQLAGLREEK